MKKIYLSSPFFCDEEIKNVRKAENILRARGFKLFVPMDSQIDKEGKKEADWARMMFNLDKLAIDKCDVVVLLYYGMYSDSGTAWEGGYAYAKNKPVIMVHCQDKEKNNLMMTNGSHTNLPSIEALATYDFDKLEIDKNFFGHTPQS